MSDFAPVDAATVDEQLFDAARTGDVDRLAALLDAHPDRLHARTAPYELTLLHLAAPHASAVDLLLRRGLDVNARDKGDKTYAMHWAAAAGALAAVRRLADAGGDVVGHGDDHELDVIGWATCWDGCDDAAHRAVADFLVDRGAHHHIFSAIALNLDGEVRRIAATDPAALHRRLSHNENQQQPLHFAVRMKRRDMVPLLLELGADPLALDGFGLPVPAYATGPDIDRPVLEAIHAATLAELGSADRGHRASRGNGLDLVAALALGDWRTAERLVHDSPALLGAGQGATHLMAKRNDVSALRWLLAHGAAPSGMWGHWDSVLTPLHLAAAHGHAEVARVLLDAGADPGIRDSKHDGDAKDWAEFFGQDEIARMIDARRA